VAAEQQPPGGDRGSGRAGHGRRALITGLTGQDGSFLAELLLAKGYRVTGLLHGSAGTARDVGGAERPTGAKLDPTDATLDPPAAALGASAHLRGRVELLAGDLHDHASLRAAVLEACPHELYHLGAPSFVPASWERPGQTLAAIAGASAALLEAVRDVDPAIRVFLATSGAMFGAAPESPQQEQTPFRPDTPYAVAKLAAHQLVGALRAHDGLFACSGILYNHESERRPEQFVTRKITRAAAAVKLGLAREVVLGDLDAVRDWSFAGDVMRGAWLMLQQERPDDYVLASGVPHTVGEFAEAAFACVQLRAEEHVRVDPELVRAPETTPLVGDPSKARRELGWRPQLSFEQLVQRMVSADLRALQAAAC
jgi:GDPmannose 4,6-dehydratase